MIYFNVYNDQKMSEQICIELIKEKLGCQDKLFLQNWHKHLRDVALRKFFHLSVYIYIFKLMIDFKFRKHTRLQHNQKTAKYF